MRQGWDHGIERWRSAHGCYLAIECSRGGPPRLFLLRDQTVCAQPSDARDSTRSICSWVKKLLSLSWLKPDLLDFTEAENRSFVFMEAEYIDATTAACQRMWLSPMIGDFRSCVPEKFKLLVNNKYCSPREKQTHRHEYHFIRECVEQGRVEVDHASSLYREPDELTKSLGRVGFMEMGDKLGLVKVK